LVEAPYVGCAGGAGRIVVEDGVYHVYEGPNPGGDSLCEVRSLEEFYNDFFELKVGVRWGPAGSLGL
jgi:hypothetical protein